eukprot:GHVP01047968.1.p1 GENE.GHVP01047968.1~~GHVP01047968.1.p1  ORF type:complete len:257 (-),score=14.90 GHVP01047968.1:211-981(-)
MVLEDSMQELRIIQITNSPVFMAFTGMVGGVVWFMGGFIYGIMLPICIGLSTLSQLAELLGFLDRKVSLKYLILLKYEAVTIAFLVIISSIVSLYVFIRPKTAHFYCGFYIISFAIGTLNTIIPFLHRMPLKINTTILYAIPIFGGTIIRIMGDILKPQLSAILGSWMLIQSASRLNDKLSMYVKSVNMSIIDSPSECYINTLAIGKIKYVFFSLSILLAVIGAILQLYVTGGIFTYFTKRKTKRTKVLNEKKEKI